MISIAWEILQSNSLDNEFDVYGLVNLEKEPEVGSIIQVRSHNDRVVRLIISLVDTENQRLECERIIDFLEPVRCANVLEYKCGCKYEFQLIGAYAPVPTPHLIPCFAHTRERKLIEKLAELDWENITSSVRS